MNPPPWLLDWEVKDLCEGLTQPAAQIRYLFGLGLTVRTKPNGKPLVMRAEFEALGQARAAKPAGKRGPDRAALAAVIGG